MGTQHYLFDIVLLLSAAVAAVPLFRRLGLGAILGYLAAGALVGPWGIGLIKEVGEVRQLSEFGVVFLLFLIGIDLKPSRLKLMHRQIFGLGSAQLFATGLALAILAALLGLQGGTALVVGFGLALSSTAIGLQMLTERAELSTRHGRASFAILLLQDIAVLPLLLLVALLSGDASFSWTAIGKAAITTAVALGGMILIGRTVLRPLMRLVAGAKNPEIFAALAVLLVLGSAALFEHLGLSMAMGAFLAGVMLADSEFRPQVEADIQPFRGFLLGLFFMSVGMTADFGLLGQEGFKVLALVLGLLVIKGGLLYGLGRLFGHGRRDSLRIAALLSQSGEFAFVLFGLAEIEGVLAPHDAKLLILSVSLSMAATPLIDRLNARLVKNMKPSDSPLSPPAATQEQAAPPPVLIAGFGRVGKVVARMLAEKGIAYLGLDKDPDRVLECRNQGFEVFYGDASHSTVLKAAGASETSLVIVTLDQVGAAERTVHALRSHFPKVHIFARARDPKQGAALMMAGATFCIPETLEASLQLGGAALKELGAGDKDVETLIHELRRENYQRIQPEM
ncbi:MAG: monovalent cation:proton antiporter-2 (CPA2) family protein [Rhodospirillales bacterium]|nr:monovalent cation:proton antiporter-2 (CPA2) family protein [Rhodospirillales bacterium]